MDKKPDRSEIITMSLLYALTLVLTVLKVTRTFSPSRWWGRRWGVSLPGGFLYERKLLEKKILQQLCL